jgi:hypothetical protein
MLVDESHEIHPPPIMSIKIEGPGAGIPNLLLKGFLQTPLLINQHLDNVNPGFINPNQ